MQRTTERCWKCIGNHHRNGHCRGWAGRRLHGLLEAVQRDREGAACRGRACGDWRKYESHVMVVLLYVYGVRCRTTAANGHHMSVHVVTRLFFVL